MVRRAVLSMESGTRGLCGLERWRPCYQSILRLGPAELKHTITAETVEKTIPDARGEGKTRPTYETGLCPSIRPTRAGGVSS